MMKTVRFILAGGLLLAASALHAQDQPPVPPTPPTPPEPPRAESHVWGGVIRGGSYLGVMLDDRDTSGAVITSITPGSPAEKAGLREKDVVVSFDGESVSSARDLSRRVRRAKSGESVTLEVIRDGQRVSLEATIGERTVELPRSLGVDLDSLKDHLIVLRGRMDSLGHVLGDSMMRFERELRLALPDGRREVHVFAGGRPRLGVELQPLTAQLAKYFGVESRKGALVGSVADSGAARSAGLQAGDVIIAIDGKEVASPADVTRLLASRDAGPVDVRIVRDRRERTVKVDLPKRSALMGGAGALGGPDAFRFYNDGRELRLFNDSNTVRFFNDGRDLEIFGNGRQFRLYNDGNEIRIFSDGDSLVITPQMMRELEGLKELQNLRDLPELRELERLPEMIREELEEARRRGDFDGAEVDVRVEVDEDGDDPAEFDSLPEGRAEQK